MKEAMSSHVNLTYIENLFLKGNTLNIYYVYQDENTGLGTYHAMVITADSEEEASQIHPDGDWDRVDTWCYSEKEVKVNLIGQATPDTTSGIILSSFS